jgi:cephalosporin-C deacetylase-like acetyl esterase
MISKHQKAQREVTWCLPSIAATILLAACLPLCLFVAFAEELPSVTVTPDHHDGLYSVGEKAVWMITPKGNVSSLGGLTYTVKKDGQEMVTQGQVDLASGRAMVTASRVEPGALVLQVASSQPGSTPLAIGGVVFDWKNIKPSAPTPSDFDEFWKTKLKELSDVPIAPVLEKVETLPNMEGVEYDKVTLGNIRGSHVRGQLACPVQSGKHPAILMLQYAGIYPLRAAEVTSQAKRGWIALNISAHDLPIDEPAAFYEQQDKGDLKGYPSIGNESRETSYFLRMFLGCVRAAEYLTSRSDWDGKTLVVTGTSQGGLQAMVTAALFKKTSAMIVLVPAGCDTRAPLAQPPRAPSWPYWMASWSTKGRDLQKVQETSSFFDGISFAERIHCPSLIAVGLLDETARPAGAIAAFNAINAPKELLIMTQSNHRGSNGTQNLYTKRALDWKSAILAGEAISIPPSGITVDPIPSADPLLEKK